MKVVILAGGFGTRISEESHLKPKPMIEIGEKPILWHIMKHYSQYGYIITGKGPGAAFAFAACVAKALGSDAEPMYRDGIFIQG